MPMVTVLQVLHHKMVFSNVVEWFIDFLIFNLILFVYKLFDSVCLKIFKNQKNHNFGFF